MQDAQLRTDFNVISGVRNEAISFIKYKSQMKALYEKAGVRTARWHLVSQREAGLAFVAQTGYPLSLIHIYGRESLILVKTCKL